MDFDMVVVGGGPAGLSCAIRAKQVAPELSVCVVEKGSDIGSHIMSGNVFEPRALDELFPDWKNMDAPLRVPVTDDKFYVFPNQSKRIPVPHVFFPGEIQNEGNYIISLGEMSKWLSSQAELAGVDVYSGFAVDSPIYDSDNKVVGVRTVDTGVSKNGTHKPSYTPGMDLLAKQVVLAEGARGSVTEQVVAHYNLREKSVCPSSFSLGLKEVWEIDPSKHQQGLVTHGVGFPFTNPSTYAGSFLYHMDQNLVHLGLVVGLDYKNPNLNMHSSLQLLKTHSSIASLLDGGKCVSYGARVLNVGGIQSWPKLSFPGGVVVGCSAGFLNLPKIKGSHTAMKSGMIAGEIAATSIQSGQRHADLTGYEAAIRSSWVGEELHRVRNVKPAFKLGGMVGGMMYAGSVLRTLRGKEPWTLKWSKTDAESTQRISEAKPITYPQPDGTLTFDILDNLARTGVKHEHDQPSHLRVKKGMENVPATVSYAEFRGPESRFCPAKVYEYPSEGNLVINAQNCIHCKCCSIKTPMEFIEWNVPEGGGGPQYSGM